MTPEISTHSVYFPAKLPGEWL